VIDTNGVGCSGIKKEYIVGTQPAKRQVGWSGVEPGSRGIAIEIGPPVSQVKVKYWRTYIDLTSLPVDINKYSQENKGGCARLWVKLDKANQMRVIDTDEPGYIEVMGLRTWRPFRVEMTYPQYSDTANTQGPLSSTITSSRKLKKHLPLSLYQQQLLYYSFSVRADCLLRCRSIMQNCRSPTRISVYSGQGADFDITRGPNNTIEARKRTVEG
jgi:hypothetical protein